MKMVRRQMMREIDVELQIEHSVFEELMKVYRSRRNLLPFDTSVPASTRVQ